MNKFAMKFPKESSYPVTFLKSLVGFAKPFVSLGR